MAPLRAWWSVRKREPLTEPEHFWGLEVKDAEKEVIVRAEIPGFEAVDLDVELRKNRLIKAAKEFAPEEKKPAAANAEWRVRRYERMVELPVAINPEKVEAHYLNGVLEVHLPKLEEPKGRRVPVT